MSVSPRPWYLPIDEALTGVREGEVSGDDFLRAVMLHEDWLVAGEVTPTGTKLGVIRTPDGGTILECYSSKESLLRLELAEGQEFTGAVVRMQGFEIFESILESGGVDRVNLNPGSRNTVHYKREQLDTLRAWSSRGRFEAALYAPERVSDPLGALAGYDGCYAVVAEGSEEGASIVLAPDAEARRMGALFSSFDTASDFAQVLQEDAEAELVPVAMTARAWIETFDRLSLDGLVFNPWSSLPPRAFAAGVLGPLRERVVATAD